MENCRMTTMKDDTKAWCNVHNRREVECLREKVTALELSFLRHQMNDINPKYDPAYEDMDEPKCGTHGVRFMFDGEDHDGKPCVRCVACLILQVKSEESMKFAARDACLATQRELKAANLQKDEVEAKNRLLTAQLCGREADLEFAERLNGELWDHLMNAWGVIANAGPPGCLGSWKKMEPQWVEVAEKWRDKWHDMRKALRVPLDQVIEELDKTEKPVGGPRLACGCLIVQTAQGQMGDHRDGCAEKRVEGALKCDDCGQAKPSVKETNCPYAADVDNDPNVPATLCDDCYGNRCDDI